MFRKILLTTGSMILVIMLLAACTGKTAPRPDAAAATRCAQLSGCGGAAKVTPTAVAQAAIGGPATGAGKICPANPDYGLEEGQAGDETTTGRDYGTTHYRCENGIWSIFTPKPSNGDPAPEQVAGGVIRFSAEAGDTPERCPDITVLGNVFTAEGNTVDTVIQAPQGTQYICGNWYVKPDKKQSWKPQLRWLTWELTTYADSPGNRGNFKGLETVTTPDGVIHFTGRLAARRTSPWIWDYFYSDAETEDRANEYVPMSIIETGTTPVILLRSAQGWYAWALINAQGGCNINLTVAPTQDIIQSDWYGGNAMIPNSTGRTQFARICNPQESTAWSFGGENDRISTAIYAPWPVDRKLTGGAETCPGLSYCYFVWGENGVLKASMPSPIQLTDQQVNSPVGANAQFWVLHLSNTNLPTPQQLTELMYSYRIAVGNANTVYTYPNGCVIETHAGTVVQDTCPK